MFLIMNLFYLLVIQLFVLFPVMANEFCFSERTKEPKYAHCTGITCGNPLATIDFGCECTEDDIGTYSTQCNHQTGTLTMFSYWKPPATCRGGGISLPAPIEDVPCNHVCSKGEFLESNAMHATYVCKKCSPGYFSIGGGVRFTPPWLHLPPQFESECSYLDDAFHRKKCSPWTMKPDYLDSGENFDNQNILSRLWFEIDVIVYGTIGFYYKFDAEEKYDKFYFEIDGTVVLDVNEPQKTWRSVSYGLRIGHHLVQWVYQKDDMTSKGADKVFIQSIEVTGIHHNDVVCHSCPPGRYTNSNGSQECTPCPAGKYAENFASISCIACHQWEKSKSGASKCLPNLPCTEFDLALIEGPCVNNENRTLSYDWLQPIECDNGESDQEGSVVIHEEIGFHKFPFPFSEIPIVILEKIIDNPYGFNIKIGNVTTIGFTVDYTSAPNLTQINKQSKDTDIYNVRMDWRAISKKTLQMPSPISELCTPLVCMMGQELIERPNRMCKVCPPGRAGGGIFSCRKCSSGTGSSKYMRYISNWVIQWVGEDIYEVAIANGTKNTYAFFSTHCFGDCAEDGWRSGGRFVDSGAGHGAHAESSLTMWINSKTDPIPEFIFFTFMLSCKKGTAFLLFYFDDQLIKTFYCEKNCDHSIKEASLLLPKMTQSLNGLHSIRWTYKKISEGEMHHTCDSSRIYKVTTKGYTGIEYDGYAGGASVCKKCGPGFYSNTLGQCHACQPGKFSNGEQNTRCKNCNGNTFTHRPGSIECIPCGENTNANDDHTQCINECRFTQRPKFRMKKVTFDLTTLNQRIFGPISTGHNRSFFYYISLCNQFSKIPKSPPECDDLIDIGWKTIHHKLEGHRWYYPTSQPIRACFIYKGNVSNVANVGAVVGYRPLVDDNIVGFQVRITHGTKLQCINSQGIVSTMSTSSVINVLCSDIESAEPTEITKVMKLTSSMALIPCQAIFEWRSFYGCYLCSMADVTSTESICDPTTKKKKPNIFLERTKNM